MSIHLKICLMLAAWGVVTATPGTPALGNTTHIRGSVETFTVKAGEGPPLPNITNLPKDAEGNQPSEVEDVLHWEEEAPAANTQVLGCRYVAQCVTSCNHGHCIRRCNSVKVC